MSHHFRKFLLIPILWSGVSQLFTVLMFLRPTWIQLWVSKLDIPHIRSTLFANPLPFLMKILTPSSLVFANFWKTNPSLSKAGEEAFTT